MKKKNLRPDIGTVILDDKDDPGYRRRQVVTKVVENDDHLTVHSKLHVVYLEKDGSVKEQFTSNHSEKRQKFLAIGGPLNAQRVVQDEAPNYVVFNRSSHYRSIPHGRGYERNDVPSAVLVWLGTFKR